MGCTSSKEAVAMIATNQEEYDRMLKETGGGRLNTMQKTSIHAGNLGENDLGAGPESDKEKLVANNPVKLVGGGKYIGEWNAEGLKHGQGKVLFPSRSWYEGQFVNGKAEGQGVFYSVLTEDKWVKYTGSFANNMKNGDGTLEFHDGGIMKGNHKDDKKHGEWHETFKGGGVFEGVYEDGVRSGLGLYRFNDGCEYHGSFENGEMRGWGRHEWPDGRVYKGEWLAEGEGQMHGVGAFYWPGGISYIGSYVAGMKQGFGIFKWPCGKAYHGYWAGGNQDGYAQFFNAAGQSKFSLWKAGNRLKWIEPAEVKAVCEDLGVSPELPTEVELLKSMPKWLDDLPNARKEAAADAEGSAEREIVATEGVGKMEN